MRIAIIDTGIDIEHKKIKDASISGFSIREENNEIVYNDNFNDEYGHGTACAGIIHKMISDAELVGIKIYHTDSLTKETLLIEALKWVDKQVDIRIVNISLGSNQASNTALNDICYRLSQKGVILVAACDNDNTQQAYPAGFPWVIGVYSGRVKNKYEYGCIADNNTYFIAKGTIQRVAWKEQKDLIVSGTSYATPHLVGIIARIIENKNVSTFEEVIDVLRKNCNTNIKPIHLIDYNSIKIGPYMLREAEEKEAETFLLPAEKLKDFGKIGIFPVSEKEMKQFIDFRHLCQCSVSSYIDYPRTFSSFAVNDDKQYLRDLPSPFQLAEVDTFVIGYYYNNLWEGNISFGNALLDLAIKTHKNFYVYDKRIKEYIQKHPDTNPEKTSIFLPRVDKEIYNKTLNFHFLPNVKAPVILVTGTGNKQGKFTTQLRIKEIMEAAGYKTGFFSTEPQGDLFGANFSYPVGYMSTVELTTSERLIFIRNLMKGINYYCQPHIIITGTQGALVPENPITSNPYLGALDTLGVIYGALPDLLVCTISPNDSIQLIKKTISTAFTYSKCKVAFYAISPWNKQNTESDRRLTKEELEKQIEIFSKELKRPIIDIMDKKNNLIILHIIQDLCS